MGWNEMDKSRIKYNEENTIKKTNNSAEDSREKEMKPMNMKPNEDIHHPPEH